MNSGLIKLGLVALVGTMITAGVNGCKKSKDFYNQGVAHSKKGETDLAISDYNKALEINPKYDGAYINHGVAYGQKGEYDQAISDCNKALEINPDFAEAYHNRGIIYYVKKEYDKTWEDVHKVQSLGHHVHPEFLKALREDSGREN